MRFWTMHLCVLLTSLTGLVSGLEITSTDQLPIKKATGENVRLDCQFTLATEDTGQLDIEWSLLAPDNQKEDTVLLLYSGDRTYEDYHPPMKGRVRFSSTDPQNGNASISLTGLMLSDSGTYQCKVQKAPAIRSRKMLLRVMVKPSPPRCYTEGPAQEGKDIVLRCVSSEGTGPLKYSWEKASGNMLLLLSVTTTLDTAGGTIIVKNASVGASTSYRCTVSNPVGRDECVLQLNVTPPPNTAGIVAGTTVAVLLTLLIIPIILFCFCRMRHKNKYEEEISNEIRMRYPPGAAFPQHRASAGSQHPSLGPMSPSNLREYVKPQYDKTPSSEEVPPPTTSRVPGVMIPAQNRDGSIV